LNRISPRGRRDREFGSHPPALSGWSRHRGGLCRLDAISRTGRAHVSALKIKSAKRMADGIEIADW